MKKLRAIVMAAFAICAAVTAYAQAPGGGGGRSGPSGPVKVGVVTLADQQVPYIVTLPGRAVAFQTAEIRPRVSGVIERITYQQGRNVTAGEEMFQIEDDTFTAALQAADAVVKQAETSVSTAEAALARAQSLVGVGSTRASVEAAQLTLAQAEAALSEAEAQRQLAKLDLDYTRVRSPIDGASSVSAVSIGAIVTGNQSDALTTVTQLDPIYVDVAESSTRILRNRDRMRTGAMSRAANVDISLTLEDGSAYDARGEIVSPSRQVSTTTGTTQIRIQFPNPDRVIMPGQFLRVAMTLGSTRGVLVPQRATSRAADGTLTAFLARDGKATQVTLTEQGSYNNAWIVSQGAVAGDQVIVDGLDGLRDGADVETVPVTISDEGVVVDQTGNAGDGAGAPDTNAATGTAPENADAGGTAPTRAQPDGTAPDAPAPAATATQPQRPPATTEAASVPGGTARPAQRPSTPTTGG
ncbi:efflux RND transporter periplasmic adaptor subunit [Paracoccus pacificus]|uniref:Efflux RND transporter periplasmic adaptor subunit n=1 Tax=Paracoccus pacificus TaxID=1463598 RepID=A0ABW4R2U5_9RHOB